jgi:hypothetical protein
LRTYLVTKLVASTEVFAPGDVAISPSGDLYRADSCRTPVEYGLVGSQFWIVAEGTVTKPHMFATAGASQSSADCEER